jgi:hypothetical protein
MGLPSSNPKVSELNDNQRAYILGGDTPNGLKRFAEALLHKMPRLKVTQVAANTKLWVYHPDETYMRGYIGYGDFRQDPETRVDTYWVFSRNIQNNRYNWGDGQYMRNSKKLDKAVQIAAMALSPWTMEEIGKMTWDDMREARSKENDRLIDESRDIIKPYLDNTYSHRMEGFKTLLDELENLVAEGNRGSPYKWLNDSFGGDLRKYFELRRKNNSILNRTDYDMVMAWVERNELQTATMDSNDSWGYREGSGHKTYPLDDIPEDLMGKMSVLHNVDQETYIPDVGVRVAEGVYYVYKPE